MSNQSLVCYEVDEIRPNDQDVWYLICANRRL